jgi:hypothetical protein
MKKKMVISVIVVLFLMGMMACASPRLITYKPTNKCNTYNDMTDLHKRQDIPKSLRNDYPNHHHK